MRRAVSGTIAAAIDFLHPRGGPAAIAEPGEQGWLAALRRDGAALLGRRLPHSPVAGINAWLREKEAVGAAGARFRADRPPIGARIASYPLATVLACPHVLELANDPALLWLVSSYLGCKPTLSSIGIRWSFPSSGAGADIQQFHRDPDDWRFLKVFLYLTDVDEGTGPHVYVAGSHRTSGRLLSRPYTPEEIARRYGTESVRTITGAAGTMFVADTYGIHKGTVPTTGPRLILQIQYSLLPVFTFRYAPEPLGRALSLDRYINRLLVAAAAAGVS